MSKLIVPLHGSAAYDYTNGSTAAISVDSAMRDLVRVASQQRAEIVWASLSFTFDVATVEEQKLTENHSRIHPGRSTVTARAAVIIDNSTITNEGSN